MWGLTLDTIQSLEVVLANGTVTTVSSKKNNDLFWVRKTLRNEYIRFLIGFFRL